MAVNRADLLDRAFTDAVAGLVPRPPRADLDSPVVEGSSLTARKALALFEAMLTSRLLDLTARELKGRGEGFYTIGSSGHEGNAAVAGALEPTDLAFLHYRSGAFFMARAQQVPGTVGAFDVLRGMVAAADEPIAGGRHKVFGSLALNIPPQTSTIASHLPKAMGFAVAMDRTARLRKQRERRIAVCTFGDASANHSTAAGALHASGWTSHQNVPAPVLFVCEDNGLGISVRTPQRWVESAFSTRAGVRYFKADGLNLPEAYDVAREAAAWVREHRRPAFLHLRTVRLLGHAGSDVELLYRSKEEIEDDEAKDPVLATARLLIAEGWLSPEQVLELTASIRARLHRLADEAVRRPKLETAEQVMAPLFLEDTERARAAVPVASPEVRATAFKGRLPEVEGRPRHLAMQLNRALVDLMVATDDTVLFGEDVARKGGVYHVTNELVARVGVGRVFNTLLDETSILGLAIGARHAGLTPIPEIQYLAYLMNAIDQLRGEAGSMQFFSNGQYDNGMVVRIAGLAYQKGFGGHFHNDNGIAALREIPGLLLGCPSRGDDAARMLRGMLARARELGRLCVLLEPIALYMTKDLHEDGDGGWLTDYPSPEQSLDPGTVRSYGDGTTLALVSYANGLYMSLRVAKRLEEQGHAVRVIDLQWLQPLPIDALADALEGVERVLVVDECRRNSGIAADVVAELYERMPRGPRLRKITGHDTYIPLGDAANRVLIQEADIERAAEALLAEVL